MDASSGSAASQGPSPDDRPRSAREVELEEAQYVLCPYCGHIQNRSEACENCGGVFEPLSRVATQLHMGPWYIRDKRMPFRPGCSLEVLKKQIKTGKVTDRTIIRGPATRQFWSLARNIKGLSHLVGYCHHCVGHVKPTDSECAHCGAELPTLQSDRDRLGLAFPTHQSALEAQYRLDCEVARQEGRPTPEPPAGIRSPAATAAAAASSGGADRGGTTYADEDEELDRGEPGADLFEEVIERANTAAQPKRSPHDTQVTEPEVDEIDTHDGLEDLVDDEDGQLVQEARSGSTPQVLDFSPGVSDLQQELDQPDEEELDALAAAQKIKRQHEHSDESEQTYSGWVWALIALNAAALVVIVILLALYIYQPPETTPPGGGNQGPTGINSPANSGPVDEAGTDTTLGPTTDTPNGSPAGVSPPASDRAEEDVGGVFLTSPPPPADPPGYPKAQRLIRKLLPEIRVLGQNRNYKTALRRLNELESQLGRDQRPDSFTELRRQFREGFEEQQRMSSEPPEPGDQ